MTVGPLFEGRLTRPLAQDAELTFLTNPCEAAPEHGDPADEAAATAESAGGPGTTEGDSAVAADDPLGTLRSLAAERAELPADLVHPDSWLLDDLHLSSLTVAQVVNQAARELGLPAVEAPTNFATATVGELAEALDELGRAGLRPVPAPPVHGVDSWVRPFVVDHDPAGVRRVPVLRPAPPGPARRRPKRSPAQRRLSQWRGPPHAASDGRRCRRLRRVL